MKIKNFVLMYYVLIVAALANLSLAIIDNNIQAFCGWLVVIILSIQIILSNTIK